MEFSLSGNHSNSGQKYTVRFVYNFNAKQITLGHSDNFGKVATFYLCDNFIPGQTYTPKLKIGSNQVFLEHITGTNNYNLVNIPNSKCLTLLIQDNFNVTPYNFPINTNLNLIPTNQSNNVEFGIRVNTQHNKNEVYTYSIVGNSLVVHLVPENKISSRYETSLIFKERLFHVDYIPGHNQLKVGHNYPVYILVGNDKYYMMNPVQNGPNVVYQLTTSQDPQRMLTYTPKTSVNWKEFSVNPSEFQNLMMPDNKNGNISLWRNQNTPAVSATASPCNTVTNPCPQGQYCDYGVCKPNLCNTVTNPCPPGQYCAYGICKNLPCNPACTNGQICVGGVCQNPVCNPACTNGQTCLGGKCVACNSVTAPCPAGQYCDFGVCKTYCSATNPCPNGENCLNGICQSPCSATNPCPTGQVCNNGTCTTPCTATSCTGGKVCTSGICQNCTTSSQCPSGQTCQNGSCSTPAVKPWWKTWWFWTIIGVILFIIFLIILYLIFA